MIRTADDELYDAFRRHDQYGILGCKPQPILERLRLALFTILLVPFKLLGLLLSIVVFWALCHISAILPKSWRGPVVVSTGRVAARTCLFCIGFVRITWVKASVVNGKIDNPDAKFGGIVCNHVSPLDILVMMTRYFPSFVSKTTVKSNPLVGVISEKMDCIYVDIRSKPAGAKGQGVGQLVKDRMLQVYEGKNSFLRPLCIFPEGTTANGLYLMPFKTGAFIAGVPIQPLLLRYSQYHVSPAWDSIPYLRLLYLMLANPMHTVTVTEFPVYVPSAEEAADPKLFADNVRSYLLKHSDLKPTEATYKDELDYIDLITHQFKKKTDAVGMDGEAKKKSK